MAQNRRIVLTFRPETVRRRYGRAALQVLPEGDLSDGSLGQKLKSYRAGEISPEAVCWEFVRSRVYSHTPTFSWAKADLQRLVELVASVNERPRLQSRDPQSLAEELLVAQRDQTKRIRESLKRMTQPFAGLKALGGFDTALAGFAGPSPELLASFRTTAGLSYKPNLKPLFDSGVLGSVGKIEGLGLSKVASMPNISGFTGVGELARKRMLGQFTAGFAAESLGLSSKVGQLIPSIAFEGLSPKLGSLFRDVQKAAEALLLDLPLNWREMSAEENRQVVELMVQEGLCLAWAPRIEIVKELVDAEDHEARCEILLRHSEEIIDDVEQTLDEVSREDLAPATEAAKEVISTYRDGHTEPAQAYAAVAATHLIHDVFGANSFGEVRDTFKDRDPFTEVGMDEFAFVAVGQTLVRTLDRFDDAGDGFNRNLTLHRLGTFHNVPNLLSVLLLLGGLIRELDRFLEAEESLEPVAA
jgi:hypothetical protein